MSFEELVKKSTPIPDSPGPLECSQASLAGHIVSAHFTAGILSKMGVPRYDLEVAAHRGFKFKWLVEEATRKIERSDRDIRKRPI